MISTVTKSRLILGETPADVPDDAVFLVFQGDRLLTDMRGLQPVPVQKAAVDQLELAPDCTHFLGFWDGHACYVASYQQMPTFDAMQYNLGNLYQLLGRVDDELFALAGRGLQVSTWFYDHQFCGKCGQQMVMHATDRAMTCRPCRQMLYPRLTPAIIVLVTKGSEMLLARNHSFPEGMYSTLAGFVEPGETSEQCVYREVLEETGIKVKNIEYFGSQSWPFPSQLMLGYFARYESGDIVPEEGEIADAQWFTKDRMPMTPPRHAISGKLIEAFIASLSS